MYMRVCVNGCCGVWVFVDVIINAGGCVYACMCLWVLWCVDVCRWYNKCRGLCICVYVLMGAVVCGCLWMA